VAADCLGASMLGREPINLGADVGFGAHSGLKSDMVPCPKSAISDFSITSSVHSSLPKHPGYRRPARFSSSQYGTDRIFGCLFLG
jgi:hypothetical protein